MSTKKKWSLLGLVICLIIAIGVTVWSNRESAGPGGSQNNQITIGSKDFTESKLVMQIWADALQKEGYVVKTKPNISSSVVYQTIQNKQVDLYPEYTGTIAMTYLKKNIVGKNADQIAEIARKGMAKKDLSTLDYAPGNDSQGIAIRTSIAKKYGIHDISDLQQKADKIRFVSQGEFDKRADGMPGLTKTYGKFDFKSHKVYDASLKYRILAQGKGDITPASTTEGQLATGKYFALKDNKHFWPAYNLVPLARTSVLRQNPRLAKTLNEIDKQLTTKELQQLNKKVDVDGQDYQTVARAWVKKNFKG